MTFLHTRVALTALAAAALLAACGGSDAPRTSAVKVAGDSLNDSGTFGFKNTVQSAPGSPTLLWVDHVAAAVKAPDLCARYRASGNSVAAVAEAASCTNYAVAGALINPAGTERDRTGFSVVQQLRDLGAAGYRADELLLVDGGGNDAAGLVGAFVGAATPAGFAAYVALLGELLAPAQLAAISPADPTTLVTAGAQYMAALANLLADTLESQALDKGAARVVVMNMPNVVRTPRFQNVLAGVAAVAGPAASAQVAAAGTAWVRAYNGQLASRLGARSAVALVDIATEFDRWIDSPAANGFSNVTQPACPPTGLSGGLPTYQLSSCTATLLSASPPAGASGADWWRTYLFSDNFHGTPRTNQLVADVFVRAIDAKGWR